MLRTPVSTLVIRKARLIAPTIAMIAAVGGCSGGGSSAGEAPVAGPSAPPSPSPPGANAETAGGIWLGFVRRNGQYVNDALCLLVEAGELACILSSTGDEPIRVVGAVHGTLKVASTRLVSGSGKIYATRDNVLTDGISVVEDFTITGGSLGRMDTWLEFSFTSLGEESTFSGSFTPGYDSLVDSLPHGVYTQFEIYGDPSSLSIDPNGALFMQTASGCSGNGQVAFSTPGYDAYTANIVMSSCPGLNGAYGGLATVVYRNDGYPANDLLAIFVFNEMNAIVGVATR